MDMECQAPLCHFRGQLSAGTSVTLSDALIFILIIGTGDHGQLIVGREGNRPSLANNKLTRKKSPFSHQPPFLLPLLLRPSINQWSDAKERFREINCCCCFSPSFFFFLLPLPAGSCTSISPCFFFSFLLSYHSLSKEEEKGGGGEAVRVRQAQRNYSQLYFFLCRSSSSSSFRSCNSHWIIILFFTSTTATQDLRTSLSSSSPFICSHSFFPLCFPTLVGPLSSSFCSLVSAEEKDIL